MKLLKDISQYLPSLTLIFIFWSVCSISSYFAIFHINIITFTSVNEIPVLFFYNFLQLIFNQLVLAIFFLVFYMLYRLLHRSRLAFVSRVKDDTTRRAINIAMLLLLIAICIAERAFYVRSYFTSSLPSTFDELAFIFSMFLVWYVLKRDRFMRYLGIILVYYVLFFGFIIADVGFERAYYLQKFGNGEQYAFRYKGKEVVCDSGLYYIGKTNDYIFLYNKHDNKTLVYEKDKVDSLSVKFNEALVNR